MCSLTLVVVAIAAQALVPDQTLAFLVTISTNRAKLILQLGDSNNDGVLSTNESGKLLSTMGKNQTANDFARLDVSKDGKLGTPEISRTFQFGGSAIISFLDTDGDGRLSVKEVEAFVKKMHVSLPPIVINMVLDTDHDGFVSLEELREAPEKCMAVLKFVPPLLKAWLKSKFKFAEQRLVSAARNMLNGNESRS